MFKSEIIIYHVAMNITVQKFGGTSMGTAESIRQCCAIVAATTPRSRVVVVVSALSGVTDALLKLIELGERQKPKLIAAEMNALEKRHRDTLAAFLTPDRLEEVWTKECAPLLKELRIILTGISYVGDVSDKSKAVVCSFGERLSSRIMCHALAACGVDCARVNAIRCIRTDDQYLEATVDFRRTRLYCRRILLPLLRRRRVPVVTGFIGKDTHGDITLLGRGGSDYTGSILGTCLDARAVEIWTDVDGVMSADPRRVKGVKKWGSIQLSTIAEMSHGGAKVLHPKTIVAAVERSIPVIVKNTFHPEAPGTMVVKSVSETGVRGIVTDHHQMLLHFEEPGMLSGVGFIERCSSIFSAHRIPIDVCATSEITVTFSIASRYFTSRLERDLSKVAQVSVVRGVAKLSVIGSGIGDDPAILARIFTTLRPYTIRVVSIGASRSNITVMIDDSVADAALVALHASLLQS